MRIPRLRHLAAIAAGVAFLPVSQPASAEGFSNTPFNWTGAYFGGHVGGGWGDTDWTFEQRQRRRRYIKKKPRRSESRTLDQGTSGFVGGVQGGYRFQFGAFVAGFEADISGTGIDGESACPTRKRGGGKKSMVRRGPSPSCDSEIEYLGSLRGTFGFLATPRVLIYGTGGFGYGGVEITRTSPRGRFSSSDDDFMTGWTAGGGIGWAISSNTVLSLEYLYYDLGETTMQLEGGKRSHEQDIDVDVIANVVRGSLTVRF